VSRIAVLTSRNFPTRGEGLRLREILLQVIWFSSTAMSFAKSNKTSNPCIKFKISKIAFKLQGLDKSLQSSRADRGPGVPVFLFDSYVGETAFRHH
jgi:hypothetical protein